MIAEPELGDSTAVVTGYAIPERPDGVETGFEGSGILPPQAMEKGTGFFLWAVVLLIVVVVSVAFDKDGTPTWSTQVSTYWTTDETVHVSLPQPWAPGSSLTVIEYHRGFWAAVHEPMAKDGGLAEPPFSVEGFHEGATSVSITGLPQGAEVFVTYVTPGVRSVQTNLADGSWGDQDGEANGVIDALIPRLAGPPHALSGEILTVSLEGEGEGGVGVWTCSGEGARLVVPVASHIIGATGKPFISDLDLSNPFGLPLSGWMRFIPDGSGWDDGAQALVSLQPFETSSWTDVLRTALGQEDNVKGTLVLGGFPNWSLSATSRNYAVDDEDRRFGIAVPGVRTLEPMTPGNLWIIPGMRHTSEVRSNLVLAGSVPQASAVTVRLMIDGDLAASADYEVPGYGLKQVNRLAEMMGVSTVDSGYLELEVTSGAVVGGLSVVDGTADDAAFVTALPIAP